MGEYPAHNRNTQGVINVQTTARNGKVVCVLDVRGDDEIMVITQEGMAIRCPVKSMSVIGRNTQGVRLIRLNEGDKVVAVAKLAEGEGEADGEIIFEEGAEGSADVEEAGGADAQDEGDEA